MPLGQPDAIGVRAQDRRQVAGRVEHVDQHVGNARLADVLHAVGVEILPRAVAQRHVQRLVEEHQAAADQIQAAVGGIRRRVRREIGRIVDLRPIGPVRRRVVRREGVAVEQVVRRQPQRLPVQENAGERLRIHVGRGMLRIAAGGVAAQHDRVERNPRGPPVRFQHADDWPETGRLAVRVQTLDRGDLEPVVAAAVHHQKPALLHVAVHRQAVGKQVVDALDVVVVAVAVALVGKHVVRPVVDQPGAQGLFHRRRVVRFQQDVAARIRQLLVEHDVVQALDGRVGGAGDVDLAGQGHPVERARADRHLAEDHVVRHPFVEPHIVDRARREIAASPARRRIVEIRVGVGLIVHGRARNGLDLGLSHGKRQQPDGCQRNALRASLQMDSFRVHRDPKQSSQHNVDKQHIWPCLVLCDKPVQ